MIQAVLLSHGWISAAERALNIMISTLKRSTRRGRCNGRSTVFRFALLQMDNIRPDSSVTAQEVRSLPGQIPGTVARRISTLNMWVRMGKSYGRRTGRQSRQGRESDTFRKLSVTARVEQLSPGLSGACRRIMMTFLRSESAHRAQ